MTAAGGHGEAGRAGADPRVTRGRAGEAIACRHLERHGYIIIETNYRSRYGELDIIAGIGNIIAFIEVKARRGRKFGEPFEAIGPRKQAQIRRMAAMWLAEHQRDEGIAGLSFRFDAVSIMLDGRDEEAQLLHLEDAFR
ncbi:MAG: YraN family protein [Thermoleophilia bacterium]